MKFLITCKHIPIYIYIHKHIIAIKWSSRNIAEANFIRGSRRQLLFWKWHNHLILNINLPPLPT